MLRILIEAHHPAHIHFFVSAPGHRHLTTQLNLAGDPDLYDDFAFATRDGLIAEAKPRESGPADVLGAEPPLHAIDFDFVLTRAADAAEVEVSTRRRA